MGMKFNQDTSVIEFGDNAAAFVAMSDINGIVHVGFAWKKGKSPTNAFEDLASFVWNERYPTRPFNEFVWYDFHRPVTGGGKNTDDNTAFNIQPVVLEGHVLRERFLGLLPDAEIDQTSRETDQKVIKNSPNWGREVSFNSLPTRFQDVVRQNLIVPAREQGVI